MSNASSNTLKQANSRLLIPSIASNTRKKQRGIVRLRSLKMPNISLIPATNKKNISLNKSLNENLNKNGINRKLWVANSGANNSLIVRTKQHILFNFKTKSILVECDRIDEMALIIRFYDGETTNIKDTADKDECAKLLYIIPEKKLILDSLLFGVADSSSCRANGKTGSYYVELIISLVRILLNMKMRVNTFIVGDAATIISDLIKTEVHLSTHKLLTEGRVYYEGYGFLPTLSTIKVVKNAANEDILDSLGEKKTYEFMSAEYINALDIFLGDRIIFLNHNLDEVIELISKKELFAVDENTVFCVSIYADYDRVLIELKELYETVVSKYPDWKSSSLQMIFFFAKELNDTDLLEQIYYFMTLRLKNLTGNDDYQFPISQDISPEQITDILKLYDKYEIHIYKKIIQFLAIYRPH